MVSRRRMLVCGAVALSSSTLAGCTSSEATKPAYQGGGRISTYPLLEESLTDERRPFDAYVFTNDELADDPFVWDALTSGAAAAIEDPIADGYDLVVLQSRVALNQDASSGYPFEVTFEDDRTIIRLLSDGDLGAPAWNGPSSWDPETGSVYVRGYDAIPTDATDTVDISFAGS